MAKLALEFMFPVSIKITKELSFKSKGKGVLIGFGGLFSLLFEVLKNTKSVVSFITPLKVISRKPS